MPKKKKKSSSRKKLFKDREDWGTLYAFRNRAQAVKAKKEAEGRKGGEGGYTIKARVKKLPNGMWAVQTRFIRGKSSHYSTKRMHE